MRPRSEYYDKVLKLQADGMSTKDIAQSLGVTYIQVYNTLYNAGVGRRRAAEKHAETASRNGDRHKCRTCMYRFWGGLRNKGANCEYILAVGHSRGCDAENCDKYRKGPPIKRRMEPIIIAAGEGE